MALAHRYTLPDQYYACTIEDHGYQPGNSSYDDLPPKPWPHQWPQRVDGKWVLVADHRERKEPIFDAELAQDATDYWLPDDTYDTPARHMSKAGPLPDGRWRLSRRHVMGVWFARVTSGEPAALEAHDELRWLRRHELRDVVWLPGDYPIVDALSAVLRDAP